MLAGRAHDHEGSCEHDVGNDADDNDDGILP